MSCTIVWMYGEEKVIGHGIAQGRQQQYMKSKRGENERWSSSPVLALLRAKSSLFLKYTVMAVRSSLGKMLAAERSPWDTAAALAHTARSLQQPWVWLLAALQSQQPRGLLWAAQGPPRHRGTQLHQPDSARAAGGGTWGHGNAEPVSEAA